MLIELLLYAFICIYRISKDAVCTKRSSGDYRFIRIYRIIKDPSFHPQIPQPTTLIHPNPATVSRGRETLSYICGLRTRIECEPGGEHSTHSDRVTNIGEHLSSQASVLNELNSN